MRELAERYNFNIASQSAVRFEKWKLLTGDPVWNVPDGNIEPPEAVNSKKLRFEKENVAHWKRQLDDVGPHLDKFEGSKKLDKMVQLFQIDIDHGN